MYLKLSFKFEIFFQILNCLIVFIQERNGSETPRGSWASFDLRNSTPDAPIAGLLDSWDADTVDSSNENKRYTIFKEIRFARGIMA